MADRKDQREARRVFRQRLAELGKQYPHLKRPESQERLTEALTHQREGERPMSQWYVVEEDTLRMIESVQRQLYTLGESAASRSTGVPTSLANTLADVLRTIRYTPLEKKDPGDAQKTHR